MKRLIVALCLFPHWAAAESATVARAVHEVILPAFSTFASATQTLAQSAMGDCRASNPDLQSAYHAAFDAWISVETYRAGPLERDGRGLKIAFWPDLKAATPKALAALIAARDIPQGADFAETSVAARGLFALEAMLYDPAFNGYGPKDPGCQLTQAIATNLALVATGVTAEWQDSYAPLMLNAGAPVTSHFLSGDEVVQSLFTAALTELEFLSDTRIGRPLGTVDRPRPTRAEARASGRSLRNVELAILAVRKLAEALAGVSQSTMFESLNHASYTAQQIKDPIFADVVTTSGHFRLLELQNAVIAARDAVSADLGVRLGVSVGFNALDGD